MASNKLLLLITGGNQGLGYYAAKQLSASGRYHIFLGSRNFQKAEQAIASMKTDDSSPSNTANIEPIQIDVNDDASIQAAADYVLQKHGYLDVLMLNAGISRAAGVESDLGPNEDGSGPSLREQYRQQYDTNVFGAAVCVDSFLPLLRKSTAPGGKRIAFTGSSTACLELARTDPTHLNGKHYRLYRSTKTALNMVMVSYARELEDEGFVVSASNPGHCGTNLNLYKGLKDPREGAKVLVECVEGRKEDVHGFLVDESGKLDW
ncbi:hypothetical protein M409DRAFT_55593 [Zasmidium cellare ATCC 36951]|uniref:NAD(P)-binding protein n=1 Tax=Zasmidium cellare ATCC 36951 TaxID=1080233 RepID=A0A6A6CF68_ZASCE|nr:uncharacterized protein M409DRAFT_55593 [Zasmidium cellare ATCC 36951]KAF2165711.1 hypothetical protein M409DRAFT_55593 [Zasmidium cellare ATCC 36951]